jgi:DNA-binding NtrC family response regulator
VQALITDLKMPRMDGYELLRSLRERENPPPAIVLTAFGNIETAITTIHDLGAFWFMEKPVQMTALRALLERAVAQNALASETHRLRRELSNRGMLGGLVGKSRQMQEIFHLIQQVARSRAAVLVTGESGTGKELVARAIHSLSPRANGPFVAINCAAMPESLMESELFGHEKGAFTGALERRAGCFELAEGGTLLLDEIGEMPIGTQAKLLRVLEDSRVRRLGAKKEVNVDVRVVAATNRIPQEAVQKGELREDLYYRLNVFHIALPPLRERRDDLPVLVEALIASLNQKHDCKVPGLESGVLALFEKYHWPGNVRELRNVLERAVILAGDRQVAEAHLPPSFGAPVGSRPEPAPVSLDSVTLRVGTTVAEAERCLIYRTLEHTRNNKTRAAEILGISLKTLHNKLKLYEEG